MPDIEDLADARTFAMGHGRTRDLIVARTEGSEDANDFEFGEIPAHREVLDEVQQLIVDTIEDRIEDYQKGKRGFEKYSIENINKDPMPIQHLPHGEFPFFDTVESLTGNRGFDETSYESPRPEFQAMRVKSEDDMLIGFRHYTNRQVVGPDKRVIFLLEDNEYSKIKNEIITLPAKLDAIYYDGMFYVFKQRAFEDIFEWTDELEEQADKVFETIEESDVLVHGMQDFENLVYNDTRKMRKLYEVSSNGITGKLDMEEAKEIINEFNLDLEVTESGSGKEGIALPDGRRVWQLIGLFNNDHLVSPVDEARFRVFGKEKRSDD